MEGQELALLAEMSRLYLERKSGELRVRGDAFQKRVFLEQGRIVFADSNLGQDSLGNILVEAEKITREQLEEAATYQAKDPNAMLGTVLVWRGFLSPEDLYWGIKFQATRIIYSLFQQEGYQFEFVSRSLGREEVLRLNFQTPNIIMEGARRVGSLSLLRELFPPRHFARIRIEGDQGKMLDLLPRERELLPLLNGRYSVKKLMGLGVMEELELLRMLHGLLSLRLLVVSPEAMQGEPAVAASQGAHAAAREPAADGAHADQEMFFRMEANRLRMLSRHEMGRRTGRTAGVLVVTACIGAVAIYAWIGRSRQGPAPIATGSAPVSAQPVPVEPPQTNPPSVHESPAPAESAVSPPAATPDIRPSQAHLALEEFHLDRLEDGRIRATFRLANAAASGVEQRGYLFIVAEGHGGESRVVYPQSATGIDLSKEFRRGDPYRFSRFKQVDAPFALDFDPQTISIVAVGREGGEQMRVRMAAKLQ